MSAVEILRVPEIREILMIGEDLNRMRAAKEVRSPLLQCSNNRKEFFVVNLVVAFGLGKTLRAEGNR